MFLLRKRRNSSRPWLQRPFWCGKFTISRRVSEGVSPWVFHIWISPTGYSPVDEIAFSWCVYNSNVTMVYGTYNELVFMGFINHLTSLGGPTLYSPFQSDMEADNLSLDEDLPRNSRKFKGLWPKETTGSANVRIYATVGTTRGASNKRDFQLCVETAPYWTNVRPQSLNLQSWCSVTPISLGFMVDINRTRSN